MGHEGARHISKIAVFTVGFNKHHRPVCSFVF